MAEPSVADAAAPVEDPGDTEDAEDEVVRVAIGDAVWDLFDRHVQDTQALQTRRRRVLEFRTDTESDSRGTKRKAETQDELDELGLWREGDQMQGQVNMRTLQRLLTRVDQAGYERYAQQPSAANNTTTYFLFSLRRSAQQLEFHEAFMKAASRVIFRADWELKKPQIMQMHGWQKANSEVLISTPRRFGKTFRHQAPFECAFRPSTDRGVLRVAASRSSWPA